ncbi:uncharacterized protein LOC135271616 [Aotus nancymaae]|uniref:uncharacterized protein LOC135271616 n=1 Tax=Aotus nancymaae TaxID=37293 RepID=UPI0030FEE64B
MCRSSLGRSATGLLMANTSPKIEGESSEKPPSTQRSWKRPAAIPAVFSSQHLQASPQISSRAWEKESVLPQPGLLISSVESIFSDYGNQVLQKCCGKESEQQRFEGSKAFSMKVLLFVFSLVPIRALLAVERADRVAEQLVGGSLRDYPRNSVAAHGGAASQKIRDAR